MQLHVILCQALVVPAAGRQTGSADQIFGHNKLIPNYQMDVGLHYGSDKILWIWFKGRLIYRKPLSLNDQPS